MVFYHRNLGFLFLSRCLIFKVQSLSSSEDSSTSISHILALVNTFLKVFWAFFVLTLFCASALLRQLVYIITLHKKSQGFLVKFPKFSEHFSGCFQRRSRWCGLGGFQAQDMGLQHVKNRPRTRTVFAIVNFGLLSSAKSLRIKCYGFCLNAVTKCISYYAIYITANSIR